MIGYIALGLAMGAVVLMAGLWPEIERPLVPIWEGLLRILWPGRYRHPPVVKRPDYARIARLESELGIGDTPPPSQAKPELIGYRESGPEPVGYCGFTAIGCPNSIDVSTYVRKAYIHGCRREVGPLERLVG